MSFLTFFDLRLIFAGPNLVIFAVFSCLFNCFVNRQLANDRARQSVIGKMYIMPRKNRVLSIGDTPPLFTLASHQQQDVSLVSYRGKEHVILTFFRGTW